MIWRQLEAYMRRRLDAAGYDEVKTPQLMDARQWEQSGHWGKYRENMFVVPDEIPGTEEDEPILSGEAELMALKPMNCPAHVLIFRQGIKSYRDLPIRLAEFGCCHRNEPHGALHGILRVRQFTQDDAHIFCREDQIVEETRLFCDLLDTVYRDLGFADYAIKLALRPEKRFGTRRDVGQGRERPARGRAPHRPRDRRIWLGGAARRGRLLFAQARIPPDRRDRPHLAMRHAAARLRPARAARRLLHRRGRREAPRR